MPTKPGFGTTHIFKIPTKWGRTIPLWVHGDEARAFQNQKLLILSYMSGLVSGCSWTSRLMFTVLPVEIFVGTTLQTILRHLADSLNELQHDSGYWAFESKSKR